MLERYAFFAIALGILLAIFGYLWLVVRAFRQRVWWGISLILFPPTVLLFAARYFRQVKVPASLLLVSCVLIGVPYAASYYERHFQPPKPYEQIVDGELRVTLTGLKDFDYALLKQSPKVVVLQMANPEVNDQTLEHLKDLPELRELDVNGTQITDAGLVVIATLPKLQTLRVARTKVTDEGFRLHLLPKESLLKLDLTGTEVKGKTKREWKKLKSEVREYVD